MTTMVLCFQVESTSDDDAIRRPLRSRSFVPLLRRRLGVPPQAAAGKTGDGPPRPRRAAPLVRVR